MNLGCGFITTLSTWKDVYGGPAVGACNLLALRTDVMAMRKKKHLDGVIKQAFLNGSNAGSVSYRRATLSSYVGVESLIGGRVWRIHLRNLNTVGYEKTKSDCTGEWHADIVARWILRELKASPAYFTSSREFLTSAGFTLFWTYGNSFLLQSVSLTGRGFLILQRISCTSQETALCQSCTTSQHPGHQMELL